MSSSSVRLDWKTLALLLPQVVGLPLLVWGVTAGQLPWWAAVPAASLLMNLSFTVWHEASHATISKRPVWNHAAGILASLFSVYPGYFARRREHLAHHRWESDPERDPVYSRVQSTAVTFFPWLTWLTLKREGHIPDEFLPLAPWQRRADQLTVGIFLFALGLSLRFDFFPAMAAVFLLPRLVIFYLHAYYICFLPHAVPGGGFQKFRVMQHPGFFWKFITLGQWAHGVHHRWPSIPWHEYPAHIARLRREEGAA